jgi:hypothetical protein
MRLMFIDVLFSTYTMLIVLLGAFISLFSVLLVSFYFLVPFSAMGPFWLKEGKGLSELFGGRIYLFCPHLQEKNV